MSPISMIRSRGGCTFARRIGHCGCKGYPWNKRPSNERVSELRVAALTPYERVLAPRPRVARTDLAGRGHAADLPADGRVATRGTHRKLPNGGCPGSGARPRNEGHVDGAGIGRGLPASGRGLL